MNRHGAVTALKRIVYGARGEPYDIAGHTLRFVPGTRPYRLKWATLPPNTDDVARYDALQQMFLATHLKAGMRAVDVGANVGQDSLIMSALCGPTGEVTAFEPNAEARETLARNIALNPHVRPPIVVAAACSDRDGRATLYTEPGRSSNSSLAASGTAGEGYDVETVRLDTWAARPPDLIKIDVEGYELRVLEGAARLLAGPTVFLCELHPYAWPGLGATYEQLRRFVAQFGRRVRYLDEDGEPGRVRYGITVLEQV